MPDVESRAFRAQLRKTSGKRLWAIGDRAHRYTGGLSAVCGEPIFPSWRMAKSPGQTPRCPSCERLGFSKQEAAWLLNFRKCRRTEWKSEVPKLRAWMSRQRALYRDGNLDAWKLQLLSDSAFRFDVGRYTWEQRLAQLDAFVAEFGPIWPPTSALQAWLYRSLHRWRSLSDERRASLVQRGYHPCDPRMQDRGGGSDSGEILNRMRELVREGRLHPGVFPGGRADIHETDCAKEVCR